MLNILTAFKTEAEPLIAHFSLCPDLAAGQFQIFSGDGIQLGISGMGYTCARNLTIELMSESKDLDSCWLNFGIAGGSDHPIGQLVQAGCVSYLALERRWQLQNWAGLTLPVVNLYTVNHPQHAYAGQQIYDMEAAGMLSALSDARSLARVVCLKLISDGPTAPLAELTSNNMIRLIRDSQDALVDVITRLRAAVAVASCKPY